MKLSKLLFLAFTVFVFAYSNLFSQLKIFNELGKSHRTEPFSVEGKLENNHLPNEYFNQKKRNTIQLDLTSVIDSIIVTKSDGSKEKYTITYDINGNRTAYFVGEWDGTKWINNLQYTYTYDSNGDMISFLYEEWDGTKWMNNSRGNLTYDINGNMSWYFVEEWDSTKWVSNWRITYTYDVNGNRTLKVEEKWNGTLWVNNWRYTYAYDSNGNRTLELREDWDGTKWINTWKYTYTYDSNGNMTLFLSVDWNGTQWENDWRITYMYDSNGNTTIKIREDSDGTQLVNSEQVTYTYDTDGNRTSELIKNWDATHWVNNSQLTYSYNPDGNKIFESVEGWDGTQWVTKDTTVSFKDSLGRSYSFYGSEINVFYSTITDIAESKLSILNYSLSQNYPNPFNPSTTISYSLPKSGFVQLKIYDILGNEVATLANKEQTSGNYKVEFNANDLTSGIYFYRIKIGTFLNTKKMILLK